MAVKILTFNCQGLGSVEKRLDVFNYLKTKQCQIYCLQDIHSVKSNVSFIRTQWKNDCIFSSGKSNSRGVAILFGNNFEHTVHNYIADEEGNYIIADLTVENSRFILINLYGPNKDCPAFFNNIIDKAESITHVIII